VVPYPGQRSGCGRAVRQLAAGLGIRPLLGFSVRRRRPVQPEITQDNAVIGVPEGVDGKTYYFPDDLSDKAVQWLHAVRAQDAQKPWMMYYSTGCSHVPHHVAKEWADIYKGQFDDGWDAYRAKTLERQKKLGIVPQDTELTDRRSCSRRGTACPTRKKALREADGGVRRVFGECGLERRATP
jgi:arylsulfatase A-like enzyme